MRLIDADAVLDMMNSQMDMQELYLPIHFKELVIDQLPTAYDVDKVVQQLEDRKSLMLETFKISESDIDRGRIYGMDKAIEIVKGGGIDGD